VIFVPFCEKSVLFGNRILFAVCAPFRGYSSALLTPLLELLQLLELLELLLLICRRPTFPRLISVRRLDSLME
jgi:hypothetical protein